MSEYVGDYTAGATVQHKWTTKDVDRAPIAPSSAFDSGDIRIYKGSSATQRTSANGINVTSPFDSLVGVHHIAIDLSDNTDAGFYAAGNDYQVVLVTAKTVDGYSVDNTVLLEFSIGNRDGTVTSLNSNVITTASINDGALTAAKLATGVITNAKFAAGAIDAAAIADNAIDAGTIASDAITSAKVADGFITAAKLANDAITAAKLADGAIDAATFASGAITAAAIAADAIGASELASDAVSEIAAAISIPSAATIADAVWDEVRSGHVGAGTFGEGVLVEELNSGAISSSSFANGSITAAAIAADAIGASELAADAVAEIAAAITIPSAASIADAVWDEATSGHTTSGTFGEQLKTDVDAILADSNELQTDWTNGGRLDLLLDATLADTNELQTDWANGGRLDLLLDATLADTNELQTDWTNGGRLDLIADAILEDTGTTLPATLSSMAGATFDTSTDSLEAIRNRGDAAWVTGTTPPTVGAIADAVWDEATSGHTTSGTFGEQLKTDVDAILDDTGTSGVVVSSHTTAAKAELQQEATDALTAYDPATGAEAAALQAAIDQVQENIGDNGDALTQVPWTAAFGTGAQTAAAAALTAYDPPTNAEMEARTLVAANYFDPATDTVTVGTNNDKTGYALTTAYDVYHADVKLNVDESNTTDEYTITWFKNGVRVTSGITSPTLQVIKRSDGTDLIASTTPTQIASTGSYKHDATTTARLTAGEDALAIVGATIDGSARTFATLIGRDSAA